MDNFNDDRTMNAIQLFDRRYIETKTLYLYYFQALPDIHYINCIDGEKAFEAFKEKFASLIVNVHKYRWYKHETKKF